MSADGFRLGILIPVWKRPEVTSIVLDYYKSLDLSPISPYFVIACSPSDPFHSRWKGYHDKNVFVQSIINEPVSNKWNTAIRLIDSYLPVNAIMFIGSDDLVTREYFIRGCEYISSGTDVVNADGLYFYSADDKELFHTKSKSVGACSILSKRSIKKFGGNVFPSERNNGIDMQFRRRCISVGIDKFSTIHVGVDTKELFVDIKYRETNINMYGRMKKAFEENATMLQPDVFFDTHFPTVSKRIKTL